jgi:hypothetical protein
MLVRCGGWCSAVQYGKDLLAGWSRVAVAVAVAQRGRVSEGQCLSLPPFSVSCSALRVFLLCFAWDLCNLQMYDAGGYPVDAAVPDIGYSALAALPTLICLLIRTAQQRTRKA